MFCGLLYGHSYAAVRFGCCRVISETQPIYRLQTPKKPCQICITAVKCRTINTGPIDSDYGKYSDPSAFANAYQWFADSSVINSVEWYLQSIHDLTGLPWSVSILLSTFTIRLLVMTPLMVIQMRAMVKHQQIMPAVLKLDQQLKKEILEASEKLKWNETTRILQYRHNFARHKKALFEKHKIPGVFRRFMLPWVQIPLWVSMSVAMRDLTMSLPFMSSDTAVHMAASQLAGEGSLWFPNLCIPDPYFILPLLFCCANLSVIEIYRGDGKAKLQGFSKAIVYFVRFISIVMLPVACEMPAGVVLYWFYSSFFGVLQALAVRSPRVRSLLRIPISPWESKTPYKDILSRFPWNRRKNDSQ